MKKFILILIFAVLCSNMHVFAQEPITEQTQAKVVELFSAGVEHYKSKDFSAAIDAFKSLLGTLDAVGDVHNPIYLMTLNTVGYTYNNLADYRESLEYFNRALDVRKAIYGDEDADYAAILSNIGVVYDRLGNYSESLKYNLQVLNIRKAILGEQNADYATALSSVGRNYSCLGDYNTALELYLQALEIRRDIYGEQHQIYALSLSNIASAYSELAMYDKSLECFQEVLEIRRLVLGEKHSSYAITLNNIGYIYDATGDYQKALEYHNEALEIRRVLFGENSLEYAGSLGNIASVYNTLGNNDAAYEYYHKVLEIQVVILGDRHPDYAVTLNNIGFVYNSMGDYEESLKHYNLALDIRKDVLGTQHPDYATSLNNIGQIYSSLGNYKEALSLYKQALAIRENVFGEEHLSCATSLNNIAYIYNAQENHEAALEYYKKAMYINKAILGDKHLNYAASLNNIGNVYSMVGDYEVSLDYYKRALEIRSDVLGVTHPTYAESLNNISILHRKNGDEKEALNYILKALDIYKTTLGEKHLKYLSVLWNSIIIYMSQPDYDNALELYSKLFPAIKDVSLDNFKFLNEAQRANFWKEQDRYSTIIYPMLDSSEQYNSSYTLLAYDAALFSKGLILASTIELRRVILESGDSELLAMYDMARAIDIKLQGSSVSIQERDSLSSVSKHLNRALMEQSKEYGDFTRNLAVNWTQVRDALGDNDVAIEFVDYNVIGSDVGTVNYAAIVLRKEMDYPVMINLTTESKIKYEMRNEEKIYRGEAAKILYEQLWLPLEQYLNIGDNVYFAPSGLLHQLNIEFFADRQSTPANERYNLYRLSSTRQLCIECETGQSDKAVLYGGLKYNADSTTMISHSHVWTGKKSRTRSITPIRGSINDDDTELEELLSTKDEVDYISAKMASEGVSVTKYVEYAGNEESFKALSEERIPIIHIATHGFFMKDGQTHKFDYFNLISAGNNTSSQDNSMKRSGLIMSGAQKAWKGERVPEDVEDGILLSEEISMLDLRGTKLVVLSACETGLGDVTSEGVFGLQRAFKMAGVETIVMSLWKVDDKATSLMMHTFYDSLLSGASPRDSFRVAQQSVKDRYADPHFWAAFIMLD